jgi:hypothetical protein
VGSWQVSRTLSSRTKENGAVLSFVNIPQTLTVPCSLISTVNFNCVLNLFDESHSFSRKAGESVKRLDVILETLRKNGDRHLLTVLVTGGGGATANL